MELRVGDKLKCKNDITNYSKMSLFEKDYPYEIIDIQKNLICLDHILYGTEYCYLSEEFIKQNFVKI